jgi:hypothetical protein
LIVALWPLVEQLYLKKQLEEHQVRAYQEAQAQQGELKSGLWLKAWWTPVQQVQEVAC